MKTVIQIGFMLGLVAGVAGCATGPVRYKTFGYREFATVEMTKLARPALKPLALPAGLVADAAVTVLDTVATPIASVPIAFELMGPCPQPTTRRNVTIKIVFSPIWFTITYPYIGIGMPFRGADFYGEWFGREAQTFTPDMKDGIEPSDTSNPHSPSAQGVGGR